MTTITLRDNEHNRPGIAVTGRIICGLTGIGEKAITIEGIKSLAADNGRII